MTQIASAIIGGETAARAPVCCVVRTSLSFSPLTTLAPPPALVLRVPAPQDGRTPADLAKSNHNRAEVKACDGTGPPTTPSDLAGRARGSATAALRPF